MSHLRFPAALLFAALVIGCKAQAPASDAALNRRVEVMVRSQYQLPSDVTVTFGARSASQFAGYQTLPVTIAKAGRSQQINFLISDDNTKLLHLDTMDLTKNPADGIDVKDRPVRGNASAAVTVVNFDDLECPYCARMHEELFPETFNRYRDKVRFIYKDYPLVDIHPWAMRAAVDANCLASQSPTAYWSFVDYLHAHGDEVNGQNRDVKKSNDALDRIAHQEGTAGKLDDAKLEACLTKQDQTGIQASMRQGEGLNIEGTPALFVDGERINGAVPKEQLWAVIDRALKAKGIEPPAQPPAAPPAAPAGINK